MILTPIYANVPGHLPPPHSSPFPGDHSPPPMSGGEPGLCGLTNNQWHMVLIFSIPRGQLILYSLSFPYSLKSDLVSCACSTVLIALLIALLISWFNGSEISFLWLRVQDCADLTRMGTSPAFLFRASHDADELSLPVKYLTSTHPKRL